MLVLVLVLILVTVAQNNMFAMIKNSKTIVEIYLGKSSLLFFVVVVFLLSFPVTLLKADFEEKR